MGQEEHLLIISGLVPVLFFREARLQPRHEVERARVGLQIEEAGVQVEVADLLGEAVFWAAFAFGGVCCGFKRVVSMQARWFSFRRRRGVFIVAAAAARRCAAFSSSKQTSAPLPPLPPRPALPKRERETLSGSPRPPHRGVVDAVDRAIRAWGVEAVGLALHVVVPVQELEGVPEDGDVDVRQEDGAADGQELSQDAELERGDGVVVAGVGLRLGDLGWAVLGGV